MKGFVKKKTSENKEKEKELKALENHLNIRRAKIEKTERIFTKKKQEAEVHSEQVKNALNNKLTVNKAQSGLHFYEADARDLSTLFPIQGNTTNDLLFDFVLDKGTIGRAKII